jgi:hypothetical protein
VVDAECQHTRFGHIGYDVLPQFSHRDMVTGLSKIEGMQTEKPSGQFLGLIVMSH